MLRFLLIVLFVCSIAFADDKQKVIDAKNDYAAALAVANGKRQETIEGLSIQRDAAIDASKIDLILTIHEAKDQLTKAGHLERAKEARDLVAKVKAAKGKVESKLQHLKVMRKLREYNKIVDKAEQTYKAEVEQADRVRDIAIIRSKHKLITTLEAVKDEIAKSGNLDGALAVQKMIDEIKTEKEIEKPVVDKPEEKKWHEGLKALHIFERDGTRWVVYVEQEDDKITIKLPDGREWEGKVEKSRLGWDDRWVDYQHRRNQNGWRVEFVFEKSGDWYKGLNLIHNRWRDGKLRVLRVTWDGDTPTVTAQDGGNWTGIIEGDKILWGDGKAWVDHKTKKNWLGMDVELFFAPDTDDDDKAIADKDADKDKPHIVARWSHSVNNGRGKVITFWSNGKINDPNGKSSWEAKGSMIIMRWPRSSGGAWIDKVSLQNNATEYRGKNQSGVSITGKRLK